MTSSYPVPPFGKPFIEASSKRIRVLFGGKYIVDTKQAKLVWEHPNYPLYFFHTSDLASSHLRPTSQAQEGVKIYDLVVGDREAKNAVTEFTDKESDLAGLLKVNFSAADAWLEEEERIYGHPKNPYKRVDVLQSSRHVRIEVKGVEIANTKHPRLLFETNLPVRKYMPLTDVRVDFLRPSDTTSVCPYKGVANFYHVELPNGEVHKDIIWYYRTPQPECVQIMGFLAFYDEKVDVWVDGEKQK
ncbi:hypothetical protein BJ138DRAFT_1002117 [Hygrophoropsis aurantiaca]|uniref:Uncharacterized protein n=1 Tax=Hygrophoropsis aurantiaca TaxID=72124 RepID=A0ACB8AJX7_9AGAM|nr:hypothetical protein BJ138DRAFT_1002117 [Hygrophoropsis aurantiaca]